jgi:hypothetical protein
MNLVKYDRSQAKAALERNCAPADGGGVEVNI